MPISMKVPILGDMGVGKTTLMKRYTQEDKFVFNKDMPATIGVEFELGPCMCFSGEDVRLQFWDLGGDDRFVLNIIRKGYIDDCYYCSSANNKKSDFVQ